ECNEQGQCYQTPFDVELTYGDGTVPVVSATRRGRGQDLNEPSALVVSPAVPADDKHNEEVEHTGLLRNQKVKDTIKCLLDAPAREQEISCTGTLQQATGSQQEQSAASDNDPVAPAYYLNIRGATAVTVNDDAGNSLTLYPIRQTTGDGLPAVTAY